jgi:hypothetical protein
MAKKINLVSKRVIFQKLRATGGDIIQFISFVHAFYVFQSHLFYNYRNYEGDVTIILSIMGTHQGDPLGGPLFVLTHLKALPFIASHFPILFISIHVHTTLTS